MYLNQLPSLFFTRFLECCNIESLRDLCCHLFCEVTNLLASSSNTALKGETQTAGSRESK